MICSREGAAATLSPAFWPDREKLGEVGDGLLVLRRSASTDGSSATSPSWAQLANARTDTQEWTATRDRLGLTRLLLHRPGLGQSQHREGRGGVGHEEAPLGLRLPFPVERGRGPPS